MLPLDVWYNIINILGNSGYLRDMLNLLRCLGIKKNKYIYFFHQELFKSRYCNKIDTTNYKETYDKRMIDLWERTGIDDGVPIEYLIKNLNKKKRLLRTIWSHEVLKNEEQKFCALKNIVIDVNQDQDFKRKYTDCIILDSRNNPIKKCYYYELNKKSKKYIDNYNKNFQKNIFIIKKPLTERFINFVCFN